MDGAPPNYAPTARWAAQYATTDQCPYRVMVFKYIVSLLLSGLVVGCATSPSQVEFEQPDGRFHAPSGKFHQEWDEEQSAELAFTATMRLTSGEYGSGWVPGAAVGVAAGPPPNLGDSVQVMLIHNVPTDPQAEVKYRFFRGGELVREATLLQVRLTESVRVHLSFDHGKVLIKVNDGSPLVLNTHLEVVSRYASVWSGSAEITLAPKSTIQAEP